MARANLGIESHSIDYVPASERHGRVINQGPFWFLTALFDALSIMLYLLVPWTAVNLVDYFFVRRGHYAITDLFTPTGIYGAWGTRGIAAYVIGFAASIPFFNLANIFEGPIAKALGDVDISWAPGLAISAIAYVILTRSYNQATERPAITASDQQLGITENLDASAFGH